MKKILIVKTSSLGDIIHTYPVVDYLREKFPLAAIDWVVEAPCAELVRAHPEVDRTLTIATKSWRKNWFKRQTFKEILNFRKQLRERLYDAVFDLQGNVKSGFITSQTRSYKKVGFASKTVHEWPNLFFTTYRYNPPEKGNIRHDYLGVVAAFFRDKLSECQGKVLLEISDEQKQHLQSLVGHLEKPYIVVCPGSAWKNKQLAPNTLIKFLALLQNFLKGSFLFVWGSAQEQELAQQLHQQFASCSKIVDRLSLSALQNLMEMSDLIIAMDSLPLHLAGTTSTPSFSIFGASSAEKFKPLGNHEAFQGSCPYGKTFLKRCPVLRTCPTGACIRELNAKDLFSHFQRWWNPNS